MSEPLVSILTTSYNRERYIAEAIESVLQNSYQNWEFIINDDGSKDDTYSIAKNFAAKDNRISLYQNEKNLGDYPNRNKTASYATGKYLVYVDSDDWLMKDSLPKWIEEMETNNACFGIFAFSDYKEPTLLPPDKIIHEHFFTKPLLSFGPTATMVRREYFISVNGFPEKYGPANDMYYNLKAASGTDTLVFPFPLSGYRIHEGQEQNNKYSYLYNNYCYLKDALNELTLPINENEKKFLLHKNNRRFFVNILRYFFKTGKIIKTAKAIKQSGFNTKDMMDAIISKQLPLRNNI